MPSEISCTMSPLSRVSWMVNGNFLTTLASPRLSRIRALAGQHGIRGRQSKWRTKTFDFDFALSFEFPIKNNSCKGYSPHYCDGQVSHAKVARGLDTAFWYDGKCNTAPTGTGLLITLRSVWDWKDIPECLWFIPMQRSLCDPLWLRLITLLPQFLGQAMKLNKIFIGF